VADISTSVDWPAQGGVMGPVGMYMSSLPVASSNGWEEGSLLLSPSSAGA